MDPILLALLAALVLAAVVLARRAYVRLAPAPPLERAFAALAPLGAAGVLVVLAGHFVGATASEWGAARLAHAFELACGYRIYWAPGEGPIFCNNYGPIATLVYLPATLFRSPGLACRAGMLLAAALDVGPALWLIARAARTAPDARTLRVWGFALVASAVLAARPLSYQALTVGPDAPALGLAVLACGLATRPGALERWGGLGLTALAATLAVWSKQTAVPVVVVLPVYALAAHGWRAAARLTLALLVVGLAVSGAFVATFGLEPLWFQMFEIPRRHPWVGPEGSGPLEQLYGPRTQLVAEARGPLALLGLATAATWPRARGGGALGEWLRGRTWPLVVALGLAAIPTSVLGVVKQGGDENAEHALWYLTCAAAIALVEIAAGDGADAEATPALAADGPRPGLTMRAAARVLVMALLLLDLVAARVDASGDVWAGQGGFRTPRPTRLEIATAFDRAHPGLAYFPQLPLVGLIAEGKAYHFEYALGFQLEAGYPISHAQFFDFVPQHARYLAFTGAHVELSRWLHETCLPEFERRVDVPELPGFEVWERSDRKR